MHAKLMPHDYISQLADACWFSKDHFQAQHAAQMSSQGLAWLLDPSSLTAKVRALAPQNFQLQLIHQAHELPSPWEQQQLQLEAQQQILSRGIYLCIDDIPYTYGRAVFAPSIGDSELSRLSDLGEQSLGDHLFKREDLYHSVFEFALLTNHARESVWARRFYFKAADEKVLVSEIFLHPFFYR